MPQDQNLWIKRQSNTQQRNISDDQQPSGDKRVGVGWILIRISWRSRASRALLIQILN